MIPRDLNTLDYLQKELCHYHEASKSNTQEDGNENRPIIAGKKPEIHFAKFRTIKLRKIELDEVIAQFEPSLKLLVCIGAGTHEGRPEPISDFGIRAIDYK